MLAVRSADTLAETVKLIEAEGGKVDAITADVTSPEQAAHMVEAVVERLGGLHIAFNNAGTIGKVAPVADLDTETLQAVLAVNLTGVFLAMKYEIAHMKKHGGGVIINASSNIGAHGRRPGLSAYAASKAGVVCSLRPPPASTSAR